MEKIRCDWARDHLLEQVYHDDEWGMEEHDDQKLFELLTLESMQAGLSWLTILKKRGTLAQAYDQFDYKKIATYTEEKVNSLLADQGVIRNKLKIVATINNAKMFMNVQDKYGSFDQFIWSFVDAPIINHWKHSSDIPASTPLSDEISKQLKKLGFKFLGATTLYAYLQAIGIVNDHLSYCYKNQ